ncbi:MAG: RNA polymerase sigma factor [Clostridia bacterium]|nr:RNA polymerase sigma factor [Clostridia bacterium]
MTDFKTLVADNLQPLERFVKFRIGNPSDAEDVLQEVLIAAYRGRETLADESMFKPWIIGIARNKCSDYFRAKAKRMEIPLDALAESELTVGMHGVTTKIVVHETLDRLGDTDKQILYLSYFKDLPQAEIASRLGIPVGTVKSRLFHAKQQFRELYPEKPKGETSMKNIRKYMPEYMPDYQIRETDGEPFAVCWEEMMGWFIVPKLGEKLSWAMYDFPKRNRTEQCDMEVVGRAEVHGIEGVEIESVEYDPMDCNKINGADVAKRRFVAQLTDTHCRYLAESHIEDGVKKLYTFLDGDDFLQSWGFGADNCGNETHIAPKGLIRKQGSVITTAKQPFMLDVVGRFEVQINGKTFDTICVIDAGAYEEGVVTEQYLDRNGRTVLWRRFNRNDWMQESYKRPWTELLPENERITVDDETYVHWYDCISDYIL